MTEPTNTFLNATFDDPEDLLLSGEGGDFDPRVFWCVNGFLFFMMVVVLLWCCFSDKEWLTLMHERRQQTDETYQQTLRERRQQRQQAKVDTPEKRTYKLLRSFQRHKVQMVSLACKCAESNVIYVPATLLYLYLPIYGFREYYNILISFLFSSCRLSENKI